MSILETMLLNLEYNFKITNLGIWTTVGSSFILWAMGSSQPLVASQCESRKTMKEPVAARAPANRAWIRPSWLGVRTKPTWGSVSLSLWWRRLLLLRKEEGADICQSGKKTIPSMTPQSISSNQTFNMCPMYILVSYLYHSKNGIDLWRQATLGQDICHVHCSLKDL